MGSLVEGSVPCVAAIVEFPMGEWVGGCVCGHFLLDVIQEFRLLPFHDFNHLSGGKSWFYFAESLKLTHR